MSLAEGSRLVASRHMLDPRSRKSVIVITNYDGDVSAGLIVNRHALSE